MCFISVEVYPSRECAIGWMSTEKKKKRNKNIKALWLSLGKGNQKWQCCSAFF